MYAELLRDRATSSSPGVLVDPLMTAGQARDLGD
jgi:hypothetical protein